MPQYLYLYYSQPGRISVHFCILHWIFKFTTVNLTRGPSDGETLEAFGFPNKVLNYLNSLVRLKQVESDVKGTNMAACPGNPHNIDPPHKAPQIFCLLTFHSFLLYFLSNYSKLSLKKLRQKQIFVVNFGSVRIEVL